MSTPDYRGFARTMLAHIDGVIEGDDLRDDMLRHGLLVRERRDTPCDDEEACRCREFFDLDDRGRFAEGGIYCYRIHEDLRR